MYKEYDNKNSKREGTAVVVFTRHICIDDRAAGTVNERELLVVLNKFIYSIPVHALDMEKGTIQ